MDEVHAAIQVNSWGNLLIATRGVLQPSKCFYSIIPYMWTNGEWKYTDNALKGEFGITIPDPDSSKAAIRHKNIEHAEKTLGAMTSPDGNSYASIQMMQDKAQQWINAVRNGHLHRPNVWFLLKVQFWPHIRYSLCSSMASCQELNQALHSQYYQFLPLGGIIQTTMVKNRTINPEFFGVGLPNLGVEALIAMSNKLLMH
jgi:hypothetical protein